MNWPIFAAVFVALLPVVVWRIRRANTVVEAAVREVADLDVCELLWAMPAYNPDGDDLAAGLDRLRAAIDEQQKGEQA